MTLIAIAAFSMLTACSPSLGPYNGLVVAKPNQHYSVVKSDAEWRKELAPESFDVLRQAGTERPFTGRYWDYHGQGVYECAACGQLLFSSKTKFESGTGWPSFFEEIARGRTLIHEDDSDGMQREEVLCSRCGSHLGHVFDDGPEPTHLRYCMNSAALKFVKPKN